MKKILKIISFGGITLALFIAVALLAFYSLVQVGEVRRFFISEVERRTQMKVLIGEAHLQMGWVMGVSFRDFALLEPEKNRPVITAERILIRVALQPLLERRMVFNEVRFYHPALQVVRNEKGKFPLLDLIANFPFFKQKETQFSLDLRRIRIEKGEVILLDHRENQGPAVTDFRDIDLNLQRIQPNETRHLGSVAMKEVATHTANPGVEFDLKTSIERRGKKVGLVSKGKVLFPNGAFDLRNAWFDGDAQVEGLPADLFWDYYGHFLPFRAVHGTLGPRLRLQGSVAKGVHVKGAVAFRQLEVDAPDIFSGMVTPGDGNVEIEVEWRAKEIRFPILNFRSKEIIFLAQGTMRSVGKEDSYLEAHLTTPFLPLIVVRKYVPARTLKSPRWEYMVRAVNQGEVRLVKAGIAGRLSEIRRLFEPGYENRIWLEAEIREGGGDLSGDPYLPVRGVNGQFVLENGILYFKGLKGWYGLSHLTEIDGTQMGVFTDSGLLELRLQGELDLGDLREQLKLPPFPPAVTKAAGSIQELSGKGKIAMSLRKENVTPYQIEGQLSLENARLQIGDFSLAEIKGDLSFTPKDIRADKIATLMAGSPLTIRAVLRNYLSDNGTFELAFDSPGVRAGIVSRVLFSSGSPQDPGTVRGTIRYQGSLTNREDRKINGSLALSGAQITLYEKSLQDVDGRIQFDSNRIDFQTLKGRIFGTGFDFNGQWRFSETPQLLFTLNFPEADLEYLLSQIGPKSRDWYDRLQARGKIAVSKGSYKTFEFSDLKTDLTLDRKLWRLENLSARSLVATVQGSGTFDDRQQAIRYTVETRIQGVPVKGFFSWFDIEAKEITGKVNLTGNFDSSGKTRMERKRNLNGGFHLEIEGGTLKRVRILVQILNLLDLSRWFTFKLPDLNKEGIRFRSITGDFKVSGGVYSTQNMLVDSDDIGITGTGQYDGPSDIVDAVVALRPFPGISSVVSYIPIIGPGIAGIKDSIMMASFRVQGPLEDATITPAPLSTLSEFFFSALKIPLRMLTLPGGEKK